MGSYYNGSEWTQRQLRDLEKLFSKQHTCIRNSFLNSSDCRLPHQAFYRIIDSIAGGNAEDIQNQIVNIRRPGSKGQLKNLNA